MNRRSSPATPLLAITAIAAAFAFTPVAARSPVPEAPAEKISLPAEEIFSDAAFGVDPVVTGPVSDEFRQRQRNLGCAEAKWPHIPVGCFPR
jgi:hypothetical protein